MQEVDPGDVPGLLKALIHDDRNIKLTALLQLYTRLVSYEQNDCSTFYPPRKFLPVLCSIIANGSSEDVVVNIAAKACTCYLEARSDLYSVFIKYPETLNALFDKLSDCNVYSQDSLLMVEEVLKLLRCLVDRASSELFEMGATIIILDFVEHKYDYLNHYMIECALVIATKLCNRVDCGHLNLDEIIESLKELIVNFKQKAIDGVVRCFYAMSNCYLRNDYNPGELDDDNVLLELLISLLSTDVSKELLLVVINLLAHVCHSPRILANVLNRDELFAKLRAMLLYDDEKVVKATVHFVDLILEVSCEKPKLLEPVRREELTTEDIEAIIQSIEGQDLELMIQVMKYYQANANTILENDQTVLNVACIHGTYDQVKWLCRHGADIDKGSRSSSLNYAAGIGRLSIVRLLLEHGADPNCRDEEGKTALEHASTGVLPIHQRCADELLHRKTPWKRKPSKRLMPTNTAPSTPEIKGIKKNNKYFYNEFRRHLLYELLPIICGTYRKTIHTGARATLLTQLRYIVERMALLCTHPPNSDARRYWEGKLLASGDALLEILVVVLERGDVEQREHGLAIVSTLLEMNGRLWSAHMDRVGVSAAIESIMKTPRPCIQQALDGLGRASRPPIQRQLSMEELTPLNAAQAARLMRSPSEESHGSMSTRPYDDDDDDEVEESIAREMEANARLEEAVENAKRMFVEAQEEYEAHREHRELLAQRLLMAQRALLAARDPVVQRAPPAAPAAQGAPGASAPPPAAPSAEEAAAKKEREPDNHWYYKYFPRTPQPLTLQPTPLDPDSEYADPPPRRTPTPPPKPPRRPDVPSFSLPKKPEPVAETAEQAAEEPYSSTDSGEDVNDASPTEADPDEEQRVALDQCLNLSDRDHDRMYSRRDPVHDPHSISMRDGGKINPKMFAHSSSEDPEEQQDAEDVTDEEEEEDPDHIELNSNCPYRWREWRLVRDDQSLFIWNEMVLIELPFDSPGWFRYLADDDFHVHFSTGGVIPTVDSRHELDGWKKWKKDQLHRMLLRWNEYRMVFAENYIERPVHVLKKVSTVKKATASKWELQCLNHTTRQPIGTKPSVIKSIVLQIRNKDCRMKLKLKDDLGGFLWKSGPGHRRLVLVPTLPLPSEFHTKWCFGRSPRQKMCRQVIRREAVEYDAWRIRWNYLDFVHVRNQFQALKYFSHPINATIIEIPKGLTHEDIDPVFRTSYSLRNVLGQLADCLHNREMMSTFEFADCGVIPRLYALFQLIKQYPHAYATDAFLTTMSNSLGLLASRLVDVLEMKERFPLFHIETKGLDVVTREVKLRLEMVKTGGEEGAYVKDESGKMFRCQALVRVDRLLDYVHKKVELEWSKWKRRDLAFVKDLVKLRNRQEPLRLRHTSDFDNNGLFYFIGTNGRRAYTFTNPHTMRAVHVTPSEQPFLFGTAANTLIHDHVHHRCQTRDTPSCHITFDTGLWLRPTSYSLRQSSGNPSAALRNWLFQGSTDNLQFDTLLTHTNDESLKASGSTATWHLDEPTDKAYRYFRIQQNGVNDAGTHHIACSGFELYGDVVDVVEEDFVPQRLKREQREERNQKWTLDSLPHGLENNMFKYGLTMSQVQRIVLARKITNPIEGSLSQVVRDKHWQWGDQDGGEGQRGRIILPPEHGWATVEWDNGYSNTYRVGFDLKRDIQLISETGESLPFGEDLGMTFEISKLFQSLNESSELLPREALFERMKRICAEEIKALEAPPRKSKKRRAPTPGADSPTRPLPAKRRQGEGAEYKEGESTSSQSVQKTSSEDDVEHENSPIPVAEGGDSADDGDDEGDDRSSSLTASPDAAQRAEPEEPAPVQPLSSAIPACLEGKTPEEIQQWKKEQFNLALADLLGAGIENRFYVHINFDSMQITPMLNASVPTSLNNSSGSDPQVSDSEDVLLRGERAHRYAQRNPLRTEFRGRKKKRAPRVVKSEPNILPSLQVRYAPLVNDVLHDNPVPIEEAVRNAAELKTTPMERKVRLFLRGPNLDGIPNVTVEMSDLSASLLKYMHLIVRSVNWGQRLNQENRLMKFTYDVLYCLFDQEHKVHLSELVDEEPDSPKLVQDCLDVLGVLANIEQYVPGVSVDKSNFKCSRLNIKLSEMMSEPALVAGNVFPKWCLRLLTQHPLLFEFETKKSFMELTSFGVCRTVSTLLKRERNEAVRNNLPVPLQDPYEYADYEKFIVRRENLLEHAKLIMEFNAEKRSLLGVEFEGENGTGNMDFFGLVGGELQTKSLGLWMCEDVVDNEEEVDLGMGLKPPGYYVHHEGGLFPEPLPQDHPSIDRVCELFRFMGSFVAKACLDNRRINLPLSLPFLKLISDPRVNGADEVELKDVLGFSDLQVVYPEKGKVLKALEDFLIEYKEILATGDNGDKAEEERLRRMCGLRVKFNDTELHVMDLGLHFVVNPSSNIFNLPEMELIPNGAETLVEDENLEEFLEKIKEWYFNKGISRQIRAFREGFDRAFPLHSLRIFTPEELREILCGELKTDWIKEDLMANLCPESGLEDSQLYFGFIEVMDALTVDEKKAFLQFVTGRSSLPPGGLANLHPKIAVKKMVGASDNALPTANVDLHLLELPDYSSPKILRDRLIAAINMDN